jgi:hypothetical protein
MPVVADLMFLHHAPQRTRICHMIASGLSGFVSTSTPVPAVAPPPPSKNQIRRAIKAITALQPQENRETLGEGPR